MSKISEQKALEAYPMDEYEFDKAKKSNIERQRFAYIQGYDQAMQDLNRILVEKTKLLSSSAAQDSVKRCTIEEIYRELFNEELPNSNPYIK